MKQTKKFLGILRIAAAVVAALLMIGCVSAVCTDTTGMTLNAVAKLWPYCVMIIIAYAMPSLCEDFVNRRLLKPRY